MKGIIFLILTIVLAVNISFSQDVISMKDSGDSQVKIIEITPIEILYKRFDNLDGAVLSIFKSEVLSVRYENGTRDLFNVDNQDATISNSSLPSRDLYRRGYTDATRCYTGYHYAATATFIVSIISPLAGLIPAIVCSSTRPTNNNLPYQKTELMKLPEYNHGYTHHAKRIKQRKIWSNFGIALGINILVGILISSNWRGKVLNNYDF